MKTTSRLFLAICVAAGAVAVAASTSALAGEKAAKAKLGEPAPEFTLVDSAGKERTLSEYKGKLVVLEWINPNCPYVVHCYKSKAMQQAYKKVKALDKEAVWLAVNTTWNTDQEQNADWIKKWKLEYPILLDLDGEVGRLYDARRTPQMFVIDKKGVLRYYGAIDDNAKLNKSADEITNHVVGAVQQIVNGETVAPDYTKPYGCSVKYKKR